MKLSPVHASGINACLGIIISADLIAFIAKNLVIDGTRQYIQLRMWNIFGRELRIIPGWSRGVTGANDDVRRHCCASKPRFVHSKPLDIARRHREKGLDPAIAHTKRGLGIHAHLLPHIGRYHLIVLPASLVGQKEVRIYFGSRNPKGRKSTLGMTSYPDLTRIDSRTPLLVLEKVGDIEANVAWPLPDPVAHVERARIIGICPVVIGHCDDVAVCSQVFAKPRIPRAVAARPMRKDDEGMPQTVHHWRRIFVKMKVGRQKNFEWPGSRLWSGGVDQHEIQRPAARCRIGEFYLRHPYLILSSWQDGLGTSTFAKQRAKEDRNAEEETGRPFRIVCRTLGARIIGRYECRHVEVSPLPCTASAQRRFMNRCKEASSASVPEMLVFDSRCLKHFTTRAVEG